MSKKDLLLKIILPFVILLIGVVLTVALIKGRTVPQRATRTFNGPLVDVMEVARVKRQVVVPGTGTVQPTAEADITPQVSGRIASMVPQMVEGGFFKKGERLFSIEKVDYELALERAKASQAQAELELMRNQSLAEIARLEWERMDRSVDRPANPLTLYEPQLKAAEAQVASARSVVRQAELDLSRTTLRAPFNCYVRSEQVDVGQYVRAGNKVATVAGTDEVEIVVPLPLEELAWLSVPRDTASSPGSPAQVLFRVGEHQQRWQGRIVRSYGEVDVRNRMAKVVVAVADPFGTNKENSDVLSRLVPGMFVEVRIQGDEVKDIVPLPRSAVRDNDTVWIADADNRLRIRPVEIIRREPQDVLVKAGLEPGDRVILSGLSAVADGMQLRPQLREAVQ